MHRGSRSHQALEQQRGVVGTASRAVVGAQTEVFVTAFVDEDRRRRHVLLVGALVEPYLGPVEGANRAVRGSEIDADVVHACNFLSMTVPCLRSPSRLMMIGSII